ncbi:hypothetical protein OIDMADRAFT_26100 [Oidiodendron maius Zn]|uniref:Uncharacterized protein n=1 Tax=Oidiodendron maius (strain Zn) TaxID=913774 RepID=A0A0C3CWL9_OIDMZ|nr:hypothetical protein OIDMADRAFT_26100 [Oidiodendron maius Zn]
MALGRQKRKGGHVVYDPFREVLSKEDISAEDECYYERVQVKGRSKHVEIYLDVGDGPAKTRTLLARVDIGQLGISEWFQRYMGNTQEIWVKGRVPSNTKINSWPLMGKSGYGLET